MRMTQSSTSFFSKQEIFIKLLLLGGALAIFIIAFRAWENWMSLLVFIFAYVMGFSLVIGDEYIFYPIYVNKIDESTKNNSHLFDDNTEENANIFQQPVLLSHQPLIIFSLPFITLFAITSTDSPAAVALTLSMGITLVIEMWQLFAQPKRFQQWFFATARQPLSVSEIHRFVYAATALLGVLLVLWFI